MMSSEMVGKINKDTCKLSTETWSEQYNPCQHKFLITQNVKSYLMETIWTIYKKELNECLLNFRENNRAIFQQVEYQQDNAVHEFFERQKPTP